MKKTMMILTALLLFLAPVMAQDVAASLSARQYDRTWRVAVRTNLFVPLLNVGAEVALGPKGRAVIGADYYYPWLRPFDKGKDWCCEAQAANLDFRWYFRDGTDPERRATGPYVGVAGAATYYDLCWKGRGMAGEAFAASVIAGWTWKVGSCRLGLGVGGGWMHTGFREYRIAENGLPYRPGNFSAVFNWWGPTWAEFMLKVPIWTKNKNKD